MAGQPRISDGMAGAALEMAGLDAGACRALADETPDLVLRLDGRGLVQGVNPAARRALGSPEALAGAFPAAAAQIEAALARLAVGTDAETFAAALAGADGE